jgi:hypothetical protein
MTILFDILIGIISNLLSKMIESSPAWLAKILNRLGRNIPSSPQQVILYPSECGDKGIDLAQQRLLVSSAFGAYFAGMLERDHSYINLKGQIESQKLHGQEGLEPLQRIYWALQNPKGRQVFVIAAEGGMGKSTLAAKIVRCLYHTQSVDMILGDSAKTQRVDPISGKVTDLTPAYYDSATFIERLCTQLGLPYKRGRSGNQQALKDIRDRLVGRRAMIIVDNLETVEEYESLLKTLRPLASRDTRVLITTRKEDGLADRMSDVFVIHLNPLKDLTDTRNFLAWHIRTYSGEHSDLLKLERDIGNKKRIQLLLDRTGGIPLLVQLILSDIARSSWGYIDKLPHLFGEALLDFLYETRWNELGTLGNDGETAKRILIWLASEQSRHRKVTFDGLRRWATENGQIESSQVAIRLLFERFLILNSDLKQGNFSLFPSLVEFLHRQHQ